MFSLEYVFLVLYPLPDLTTLLNETVLEAPEFRRCELQIFGDLTVTFGIRSLKNCFIE